jgi:hypothetical protein
MTKPHEKPTLIPRTETRANPSANNQAQIKGIRAEDKRLKAQILAVPPEGRSPFDQSCRSESKTDKKPNSSITFPRLKLAAVAAIPSDYHCHQTPWPAIENESVSCIRSPHS